MSPFRDRNVCGFVADGCTSGAAWACDRSITIELTTKAAPHKLIQVTRSLSTHQPSSSAITGFTKVYVATIGAAMRSRSQRYAVLPTTLPSNAR